MNTKTNATENLATDTARWFATGREHAAAKVPAAFVVRYTEMAGAVVYYADGGIAPHSIGAAYLDGYSGCGEYDAEMYDNDMAYEAE